MEFLSTNNKNKNLETVQYKKYGTTFLNKRLSMHVNHVITCTGDVNNVMVVSTAQTLFNSASLCNTKGW